MLSIPRALLVLSLLGTFALAQTQPPPVPPEARQFDFWIGHWEVSANDKVVGENRIEPILGKRVLRESYTTGRGFAGHSYNSYNASTGHWEQFWVDNTGTVLHLVGGLNAEGQMVLAGDRPTKDGPARDRITWTPLDDGTVRQHWEVSADSGGTWNTIFDGIYRRVADE